MRFAVISDIHNNFEAFRSIVDDIERQEVDKICCLGDLLGYGPEPLKCVDLMLELREKRKIEVCLPGNHDSAVLFGASGFNAMAEEAVNWTREKLEGARDRRASTRLEFLGEIQIQHYYHKGELLFVHGSPRNHLNEYVFEEDAEASDKMSKLFATIVQKYSAKYCFTGHTHVPGIFVNKVVGQRYEYYSYKDLEDKYRGGFPLGNEELIINVGSVGQPRDGDPRSCYVLLNYEPKSSDNYVEYRRIEYDVRKTIDSFSRQETVLSHNRFLAERLETGR